MDESRSGIEIRDIGGVGIAALTSEQAIANLSAALSSGGHVKLAFCNAHLVNLAAGDPVLRAALSGFLVLADGIGVDIGSRLLHGASFPANLNGTDFIPTLLASQSRPLSVALLGARPGVADKAAAELSRSCPRHRYTVLGHGFFTPQEEPALLSRLETERPDILLVAFGNPRQERWIAEHVTAAHCGVAAGVGALFDFLGGEVARAPESWRRWRLEWLYRLWLEPARLWRRYVVGNPVFLLRMLRLKLQGRIGSR